MRRTKTIEVNLEDELVESLYLTNLEDQAMALIQEIRATVRALAKEEKVYIWEDLFNHVRTYMALEEMLKYNSWEHSQITFFPTDELLEQPAEEWDIVEKPKKKKRRKKK